MTPNIPCVIIGKEFKERKVLLEKHRGFYIFTDDDRMFGVLTSKEVATYYDYLDNPQLLQVMLNGFKEKIINFCEPDEGGEE